MAGLVHRASQRRSFHSREVERPVELVPYQDTWDEHDRHANFKAEVALYSQADPLPTLENLSRATGVPVPCLVRYILVKYAASGADALLSMTPIVFRQMEQQIQAAETAGTDTARLQAYEALRQIVTWLKAAASEGAQAQPR